MIFGVFWFCLTLSVPENLKILIFDMPIILQIVTVNNSKTTRAKSVNLHTIRKFIEYTFKKCLIVSLFAPVVFEVVLSEGRLVFPPCQMGAGDKKVHASVKKEKKIF